MIKKILLVLICKTTFLFSGCITPEVFTNYNYSPGMENVRHIKIAVMPLIPKELSESEVEDINDDIVSSLDEMYIKDVILPEETNKRLAEKGLIIKWESAWDNFHLTEKINLEVLKEIGNELDVDAILQFAITDIKRTRPVHRKVIGDITAEVKFCLFSTESGAVLSEATSVATQKNAWSGQMVPRPIEAIDAALEDILDNINW